MVGNTVGLAATPGNPFTVEPIEEVIRWEVVGLTQDIASVSDTGRVTGLKEGTATIQAWSDAACVGGFGVVHVYPIVEGFWRLEVVRRVDLSQKASCTSLPLPEPYTVQISTSGSASQFHPGSVGVDWSVGATSLRPEFLSGGLLGYLVEVRGSATWQEAGQEPVRRECNVVAAKDGQSMTGGCSFDWLGDYIQGVGFIGCHGTDEVLLTRPPP